LSLQWPKASADRYKTKANCALVPFISGLTSSLDQRSMAKLETRGYFKKGECVMKFQVYQDKKSEWRWRLRHQNGNILAMSSEGYKSKDSCMKCIETVKSSAGASLETSK
jgi:uncharacterized protein